MKSLKKIRNLLAVITIAISFLFSSNAYAADEISVTAKNQSVDIINNTSTFNGDVVIKQGELTIEANQAVISKRDNVTIIRLSGSPVEINKKSDGLKINARTVIYNSSTQNLVLTSAVINLGQNITSGDKIEFNLKTGIFTSSSGSAVKTIIKSK